MKSMGFCYFSKTTPTCGVLLVGAWLFLTKYSHFNTGVAFSKRDICVYKSMEWQGIFVFNFQVVSFSIMMLQQDNWYIIEIAKLPSIIIMQCIIYYRTECSSWNSRPYTSHSRLLLFKFLWTRWPNWSAICCHTSFTCKMSTW